jgi:hypothetical protein
MHRKEVNAQSPLRILEQSIRGGLGKGNLGVVIAPAGVGKSACLVQIGLDDLMQEKAVLHVAVGQTVEHVSAWYDALFDDLAETVELADRGEVRETIGRRQLIRSFPEGAFTPARLDEALAEVETHLRRVPSAILVDGFEWARPGAGAEVAALKATARRVGAELWMTARTSAGVDLGKARSVPPPCDRHAALIDVALVLEPVGSLVKLRLVKDFDGPTATDVHVTLHSLTLRLMKEGEPAPSVILPAGKVTLLATGSAGAEAQFGACAERWGVHEVNFTFRGRGEIVRSRGLVDLTEEELKLGEVSSSYLKAHMHRTYPDTPVMRRVLQAIWHQVSRAGEVFSVGTLLPDKTAHGGTGWAVELARHWGKPVHVFDQEKKAWYAWKDGDWVEEPAPAITRERFAGAGTRSLSADGKAAIEALFERSFAKRG